MKPGIRGVVVLILALALLSGCRDDEPPRSNAGPSVITIADVTGLAQTRAVGLLRNLDLVIRIERVDAEDIAGSRTRPPTRVVVRQDPLPGTRVDAGATLTLYVTRARGTTTGEQGFRLVTHCGLSYPLEFAGRNWLPVEYKLRRTINPPEGFSSHSYYDKGTIRRIDDDTLIYTSSTGIEVEYAPTTTQGGGCE